MAGFIVLLAGESCSLEQMISRCFGVDDIGQYGLNWLKTNFLGDVLSSREFTIDLIRGTSQQVKSTFIDESILDQYRFYHPYMFQRKMNEEVIEIFDIGYDNQTDCITFPVRDKEGNCLFIARRSVKTKYFNYPQDVEKPVYGIYELYQLQEFPKEVYICESMIDAITLWTHKKYAVALNGLGTDYQFKQLNKLSCRKFILATDNDVSGERARARLKEKLANKIITEIKLPNGRKDVNECNFDEIENLEEVF